MEHGARIPLAAVLSYWWDSAGGWAGRLQCRITSPSQVLPRGLCSPTSETDFTGNKNRANICSFEIFKYSLPITREYGNKSQYFFLHFKVISLSSYSCYPPQGQLFFQLEYVVQKRAPSVAGLLPVKYTSCSHTNSEFDSQVCTSPVIWRESILVFQNLQSI